MKSLIRFSVDNRFVVLFVTLLICVYGMYCYKKLPIDAVPDTTNTQVQVISLAGGLIPEEVERQITFPIEQSLNGIQGIEEVRSVSRFGLSHITVIFEEGTKILDARQLISERLTNIKDDLPSVDKLFMGPIVTGLGDIFHYAIVPVNKKFSELSLEEMMELRAYQEWVVRPALLKEKGVAEVNTMGSYQKQYFVLPNIQKMHFNGVSFREIVDALKANNFNVGGSYYEEGDSQVLIQGAGLLKNIHDIQNVPIRLSKNLKSIFIKDIADVRLDKTLIVGSATMNGEMALVGSPLMLAGGNSRQVAVRLQKAIVDINDKYKDKYKIIPVYDRAALVNETLGTVNHNLYFGCGLVILVLLLLIGDMRAALITSVMIPVSLLITFIIMTHTKISGNLMSLGALDFGVIIDGVVVIIDNCLRQMLSEKGKSKRDVIIDATSEIMSATTLGRIIIILVFVPLLMLTGVEGKMFAPMALTFIYALLAVLVLSFTTVPALAFIFLNPPKSEKDPLTLKIFKKAYLPMLDWSLPRFWRLTISSLLILGGSLFWFTKLGGEFIPRLDEGSAAVRVVRRADIAPNHVVSEQMRLEKELLKLPEVKTVFSRIGTPEVPDDPNGVNFADMFIEFKPKEDWRAEYTRAKIRDDILKSLNLNPGGATFMMGQPIEMRTNELLEGTRSDISLKIFGENLDELVSTGEKLKKVIREVRGAQDVELDVQGKNKLLKITANETLQDNLAFGNADFLETVQIALGGVQAGRIYEDIRSYPLMVRMTQEDRANLNNIKQVPVTVGEGLHIPLEKIAHVDSIDTYSMISRENSNRRIALLINVKNRDIESFVNEAAARVEKEVKIPRSIDLVWGGNFKNLQNAKERLSIILPITLLMVFMIIYYAFFNWGLSLMIFACIPFAWVGGIIALGLFQLPFSISAGVGFIALSGIAVINGMVLITYFNNLKAEGVSGDDIIHQGVELRLRPVLMTALTDIFGFLPMAFSTGLGAEVQKPLALVVIGGVISATLLTLLFIPTLYRKVEHKIGLGKIIKH
jgi:heavy metal efflux system protein